MTLEVVQIPCLSDNYGYLIRDETSGLVATIDTPDANAINQVLEERGWTLSMILNTHHHFDHVGGNLALKDKWNCEIIGPAGEKQRIPAIEKAVGNADRVEIGQSSCAVMETPGHTLGHVVYHFEEDNIAFVGDTLFALGCGRLFEGTPAQMWASLSKIALWPKQTKIYCAHEYTAANAQFALSIDPDNQQLKERHIEIKARREKNLPTVPSLLQEELVTNPFLRADNPSLQQALSMTGHDVIDVFAQIRHRKDQF